MPGGEYSFEVDPRTVTPERLRHLAQLGFNRLSFGVQDFDPIVQKAVHRIQPAEQVFALVAAAREIVRFAGGRAVRPGAAQVAELVEVEEVFHACLLPARRRYAMIGERWTLPK